MIVSLADAKLYLRIDTHDDDAMIESLLQAAENLCADVARKSVADFEKLGETAKIATLYALGYFYENRANADYQKLTLTLRSLLYATREEGFFGDLNYDSSDTGIIGGEPP